MKRYSTILILLIFISYSCSVKEPKTDKIKTISLQKTDNIQPVSSFFFDVSYIELKYPAGIRPGKIERVKLVDNDIIIKQSYAGQAAFIRFSADGRFLNKIGDASGKNVIREPLDITAYNNDFALWATSGVHVLTKENEYQRKIINANQQGDRFFYAKNKFFFFHEFSSPGYLSEYSVSGKLDKIFRPVKAHLGNTDYAAVAEVSKNKFHLFSPLSDTVFVFSNEKLLPEYTIAGEDYPTYNQLLKDKDFKNETEKMRYINNNQHWIITNYLENKNYIFMVYRLGSNPFYQIIRKSDWKTDHIEKFINDIDGGVWDNPYFITTNNELYIPLTSNQITGHKIFNKSHHGFEKQMDNSQESDNPVLMVCKLKN